MAVVTLGEIQNDYGTYQGNTLVGELGSKATIPNIGLDDIVGVSNPNLYGIVIEIANTMYTNTEYLNELKSSNNPYIDKNSLPIVSVSTSQLSSFGVEPTIEGYESSGNSSTPIPQSVYAETTGFKPMESVEQFLTYLGDFFDPLKTDKTLPPSDYGTNGVISISPYYVDVDLQGGAYPGMRFAVNASADGQVLPTTAPSVPDVVEPEEPIIIKDVPKEEVVVEVTKDLPDVTTPSNTGGSSGGSFRDVRFDQLPDSNDFLNNSDDFTLREAQNGRVF